MNKDSYIFECLCRGISDETWKKFNQIEKDSYVKNHPHCRFAADPDKTLPTQIKPVNKELRDRCGVSYDAMELEDGRLLGVRKLGIETEFCFGYGQNGVSTQEDYDDANRERKSLSEKDVFFKRNIEESGIDEKINKIKNFIKGKKDAFGDIEEYPPFVYSNIDPNIAEVGFIEDDYYYRSRGIPSRREAQENPELLNDFIHNNYCRRANNVRPLTKKEAKEYLSMLESSKENFKKRLETYWKKYQGTKLHTWTYLVD